jgi:hypothetical protein
MIFNSYLLFLNQIYLNAVLNLFLVILLPMPNFTNDFKTAEALFQQEKYAMAKPVLGKIMKKVTCDS